MRMGALNDQIKVKKGGRERTEGRKGRGVAKGRLGVVLAIKRVRNEREGMDKEGTCRSVSE